MAKYLFPQTTIGFCSQKMRFLHIFVCNFPEADMIVKVHTHKAGAAIVVLFHHDVGHLFRGGVVFKCIKIIILRAINEHYHRRKTLKMIPIP